MTKIKLFYVTSAEDIEVANKFIEETERDKDITTVKMISATVLTVVYEEKTNIKLVN